MAANETWHIVRAPRERLPTGNPAGWDFEALALFERELNGEVGVGSGIHDPNIWWDDILKVDDDHFMAEEKPGLPRNGDAVASSAAHMSVASPNDVGDETVPHAGASASAIGREGDRERDLVSRFGRLGSAVLPEVDVGGGDRGCTNGVDVPGTNDAGDDDFQLMYVRRFLRQDGDGTITERVYDVKFD